MKEFDVIQGSDAWHEIKKGIPSASNADRIITPKRGLLSACADDLICELIAARYRVGPPDDFKSRAMERGLALEPEARNYYAMIANVDVRQVGFCLHDSGRYGASLDGLIGEDGILEIKAPEGKEQVRTLLEGAIPSSYLPQLHFQLLVTGRKYVDYLSYHPEIPAKFIARVEPDKFTDKLKDVLSDFLDRYDTALRKIQEKLQ